MIPEIETAIEIPAEEVGASVLHKTDGLVIAEGNGAFAEPGRGQRLSYVRPGGVFIDVDQDGARWARAWAMDAQLTRQQMIGF